MQFDLHIDMDNDAFQEGTGELRRLLTRVRSDVERGEVYGPLVDFNGNHVGSWSVWEEET